MLQANEFDKTYNKLLDTLHKGGRAHLEFSDQLLSEMAQRWHECLKNKNSEQLNAILCMLEHARHPSNYFDDLFFLTLENPQSSEQCIFTLAASWKHLIARWSREGTRIPMRYIEILRTLVQSPNMEVREWTLRTIDQIGPQGKLLINEIVLAKNFWRGLINPHAKAVNQLVAMLENRWAK